MERIQQQPYKIYQQRRIAGDHSSRTPDRTCVRRTPALGSAALERGCGRTEQAHYRMGLAAIDARRILPGDVDLQPDLLLEGLSLAIDRKSTRLNSSH